MSGLERLRTEYCFEITVAEMLALAEYEGWHGENVPAGKSIDDVLGKVRGLDEIEWDGHFGNYIYFRLDWEFDKAFRHKRIISIIRRHVDRAVKKVSK